MKKFILGFCCCALLTACATRAYTSYIMEIPDYQGKLKARNPKDDLDMSVCEPDQNNKDKCRVLLTSEYERAESDVIRLKQELKACQDAQR